MPEVRPGVVSVILVNFRGAPDTIEAVEAVSRINWPMNRLEVIVVENASGDGSAELIRAAAPWVTVVEAPENLGFAAGCNYGVHRSTGEYIALLNSDAKPDEEWISAAVTVFDDSADVAAVASKVLDWNGLVVDYIDSGLTWFGKGYKPFVGETAGTLGSTPHDVLFGTGAAMFVRRDAFLAVGGFDERYFMFYEDVDLGWRLNLKGWKFRYEPASTAFHKHHGTVDKFGQFKEDYLLERNALFTLYKNLEGRNLDSALPAALLLMMRRAVSAGALDSEELDFRNDAIDSQTEQSVPRVTLASVYAVDQFVEQLPSLSASRSEIQSTRRVTDRALWSLFGRVDVIPATKDNYRDGYEKIVNEFPVTERPNATKVLVITGDPIGEKMAGPAIRAWHMASALANEHDVTLVSLSGIEKLDAPFAMLRVRPGDNRAFEPLEKWADVIIFQGHALAVFDALQHTQKILIADIYDPMHLEQLEQGRELPAATWEKQVGDATRVLNEQLIKADFFLCASERQRMFYLGQLAALGRINPANYSADPDLARLIALVPFGVAEIPPDHRRPVLKGVKSGIAIDDKLLLWGGGLYNWFDPLTLIEAMADIAHRRVNVRLFFQGTKHPHPGVPEMRIVRQSRELAAERGILNKSVFFNDSWVDYADRENYLLEADAGVSTHFQHIETTFSFRTRILDYLWAGLPMVVTDGDSFAELVKTEGLGIVVPERDVAALAEAIEKILFDVEFIETARKNVARVRERFLWSATLAPLLTFVRNPTHAADFQEERLIAGEMADTFRKPVKRRKAYGVKHDLSLVAHHLRHGGLTAVMRKILVRMRSR